MLKVQRDATVVVVVVVVVVVGILIVGKNLKPHIHESKDILSL